MLFLVFLRWKQPIPIPPSATFMSTGHSRPEFVQATTLIKVKITTWLVVWDMLPTGECIHHRHITHPLFVASNLSPLLTSSYPISQPKGYGPLCQLTSIRHMWEDCELYLFFELLERHEIYVLKLLSSLYGWNETRESFVSKGTLPHKLPIGCCSFQIFEKIL